MGNDLPQEGWSWHGAFVEQVGAGWVGDWRKLGGLDRIGRISAVEPQLVCSEKGVACCAVGLDPASSSRSSSGGTALVEWRIGQGLRPPRMRLTVSKGRSCFYPLWFLH